MNLVILISLLLSLNAMPASEGELIIYVEGIKKIEGNIGILVFEKNKGFPENAESAIIKLEVKVTSTKMKLNVGKLPFGKYAIALVHDVNANKTLDKNILGIPKEPFGFSNNKSILWGLPDFEDAAVSFQPQYNGTTIKLIEL